MASPLNPSHRTNSVRPEISGRSAPVRFDRYGPKSKDMKATAGPTLPSLFCCLCCLLVFRLFAGENSFGPHIPGWSLWLQCLAHWLWLSCSKIPFAEKQKGCCASIGQPEWGAEKRIVAAKEGAETCWPQLLLVVRCCRLAFTVIFLVVFSVTVYCRPLWLHRISHKVAIIVKCSLKLRQQPSDSCNFIRRFYRTGQF